MKRGLTEDEGGNLTDILLKLTDVVVKKKTAINVKKENLLGYIQ